MNTRLKLFFIFKPCGLAVVESRVCLIESSQDQRQTAKYNFGKVIESNKAWWTTAMLNHTDVSNNFKSLSVGVASFDWEQKHARHLWDTAGILSSKEKSKAACRPSAPMTSFWMCNLFLLSLSLADCSFKHVTSSVKVKLHWCYKDIFCNVARKKTMFVLQQQTFDEFDHKGPVWRIKGVLLGFYQKFQMFCWLLYFVLCVEKRWHKWEKSVKATQIRHNIMTTGMW